MLVNVFRLVAMSHRVRTVRAQGDCGQEGALPVLGGVREAL
jgi:hypothetical protein